MHERRHIYKVKIGRASYMIAAATFADAIKQAEAHVDKERTRCGGVYGWSDQEIKSVTKVYDAHDLLFTTTSELG